MAGYQLALDYRTEFTSTSITLANVDLITNSGIFVLQHLARVTKNLDIGTEFLYQTNPMMPGGHIGITSFVSRYRGMKYKIQKHFKNIFAYNIQHLIGLPV
jgi:hypothetical protein